VIGLKIQVRNTNQTPGYTGGGIRCLGDGVEGISKQYVAYIHHDIAFDVKEKQNKANKQTNKQKT
jgi:hypothetical protein